MNFKDTTPTSSRRADELPALVRQLLEVGALDVSLAAGSEGLRLLAANCREVFKGPWLRVPGEMAFFKIPSLLAPLYPLVDKHEST